ncbi:hypothetical protein [Alicyclobacillus sendaiensis]|nr:hypothetical protein [Alicyclobacillus sendaiensis]
MGAITPWNWPFYLNIRVVASALATNCVVGHRQRAALCRLRRT